MCTADVNTFSTAIQFPTQPAASGLVARAARTLEQEAIRSRGQRRRTLLTIIAGLRSTCPAIRRLENKYGAQ